MTEGTRQLLQRWSPEVLTPEVRDRARQATGTPEHAAKISAAKRGRKRSPETVERMRQAQTGKRASSETRAKMREAHLRRCAAARAAGIGWQAEWDVLLGTMPDKELARQLGMSAVTVYRRRTELGVASYRRQARDRLT